MPRAVTPQTELRPLHRAGVERTKVFEQDVLPPPFHERLLLPLHFGKVTAGRDKEFLLQTRPVNDNSSHVSCDPRGVKTFNCLQRECSPYPIALLLAHSKLRLASLQLTERADFYIIIQIHRSIVLPNRTTDPSSQLLSPVNVVLL